MDLVPVKWIISEQEYKQSQGTVRDMLVERGFSSTRHGAEGGPTRIYGLQEHANKHHVVQMPPLKPAIAEARNRPKTKAEEEAEAIRQRVAAKVEAIAHETRALYQQRLEKALNNGIFDEETNRTRMQSMYKTALLERINWAQLEREAAYEIRSGLPMQSSSSGTPSGKLGSKLDRLLQSKEEHALEKSATYKRILKRREAAYAQAEKLGIDFAARRAPGLQSSVRGTREQQLGRHTVDDTTTSAAGGPATLAFARDQMASEAGMRMTRRADAGITDRQSARTVTAAERGR